MHVLRGFPTSASAGAELPGKAPGRNPLALQDRNSSFSNSHFSFPERQHHVGPNQGRPSGGVLRAAPLPILAHARPWAASSFPPFLPTICLRVTRLAVRARVLL